jgi:hypothetical protein
MLPKAQIPGIGPVGGHRRRPGSLAAKKVALFYPVWIPAVVPFYPPGSIHITAFALRETDSIVFYY